MVGTGVADWAGVVALVGVLAGVGEEFGVLLGVTVGFGVLVFTGLAVVSGLGEVVAIGDCGISLAAMVTSENFGGVMAKTAPRPPRVPVVISTERFIFAILAYAP